MPGPEMMHPTRVQCYLAFNYAVRHPFAMSSALEEHPLTVPELEQAIALGAISDHMVGFMGMENPLTVGRKLLADPEVNEAVTSAEDVSELELLLGEVDCYCDVQQPERTDSGTSDY